MATARRTATKQWPFPLTVLGWLAVFVPVAIVITLVFGLTIRAYRSIAGSDSAAPVAERGCSQVSTEPCNAREALLKLAAAVESGEKPVHPKVEARIAEAKGVNDALLLAKISQFQADAEKDKAKFEQTRSRELQQSLRPNRPASTPSPSGADCNSSENTRRVCDILSR